MDLPLVRPEAELALLHPEVAGTEPVRSWIRTGQLRGWTHSPIGLDGRRRITCERTLQQEVFTAALERTASGELVHDAEVLRLAGPLGVHAAKSRLGKELLKASRVDRAWPECDGTGCAWNFRLQPFLVDPPTQQLLRIHRERVPALRVGASCAGLTVEGRPPQCTAPPAISAQSSQAYLGSDDAHHVEEFAALAHDWAGGESGRAKIADRIMMELSKSYTYVVNSYDVGDLTWSDHSTCRCLAQSGQCDEIAVTYVTLLRALGIPARVVILTGLYSMVPTAHAFAEVQLEDGSWMHAEPAGGTTRDPRFYDLAGFDFIAIMRSLSAVDAASNRDFRLSRDPDGDGGLNPYCDFTYDSPFPGVVDLIYGTAAEPPYCTELEPTPDRPDCPAIRCGRQ